MLRDLKNNNNGVVFVTVLFIIIVAMVLALSAVSLNISQIKSSENELKYIQSELLAYGAFAEILTSQFTDTPLNTVSYTVQVGDTDFQVRSDIQGTPGPVGSNSVDFVSQAYFF